MQLAIDQESDLARIVDDVGNDVAAPCQRRAQMPSFDFRRSLTACGLALPPDDFIT